LLLPELPEEKVSEEKPEEKEEKVEDNKPPEQALLDQFMDVLDSPEEPQLQPQSNITRFELEVLHQLCSVLRCSELRETLASDLMSALNQLA
jgi:hypothetical protein